MYSYFTEGLVCSSKLISTWNKNTNFNSVHKSDEDVTGGILYKAQRGLLVAPHIDCVYIVNGKYPERIRDAISDKKTVGTKIA